MRFMTPSLTDTLCTRCGICCDGSLFADVELSSRKEATRLEILGLVVEDDDADGSLLSQPCTALHGTRCTIYAHRPRCCRTFECRLLQDVRHGAVGVEQAAASIADALEQMGRVKTLLIQLGHHSTRLPLKERCAEALGRNASLDPRVNQKRAELESAMAAVETLLRKTFTRGSR